MESEVNEEVKANENNNKIKAKDASLIGQIVAAIWVGAWSAFKFIKTGDFDIEDVLFSGVGIAACFSPVYFNLIMDKIREIRFGK